jgi:putative heme iron utilization protein
MSTKTVNYTPEMTAKMVEAYKASPTKATVEALATEFGKTVKSVVAKLSREKVYVKAEKASETKRVPKEALVAEIAEKLGVNAEKLDGLEKVSAAVLKAVSAAL